MAENEEGDTVEVRVPVRDRKTGERLGYKVRRVARALYVAQTNRSPRLASWEGVTLHREGEGETPPLPAISPEEYELLLKLRSGELSAAPVAPVEVAPKKSGKKDTKAVEGGAPETAPATEKED